MIQHMKEQQLHFDVKPVHTDPTTATTDDADDDDNNNTNNTNLLYYTIYG